MTAGGDKPSPRAHYCSVVSSTADDSSFQMIIYGGYLLGQRSYSDVFVLSMPSFTWVRINDNGNPDRNLGEKRAGRRFHTCELYGDRQMLVLGGDITLTNDISANNVSCNSSYAAIAALDTTTFTWQKQFNPKPAAYGVSDQLQGVTYVDLQLLLCYLSANRIVSLTSMSSFNSTLANIFSKRVPRYNTSTLAATTFNNNTSASQPSTTSPSSSLTAKSSSVSKGAISGGVIGGVAALALLVFAAFFLKQRRGKRRSERQALLDPYTKHDYDQPSFPRTRAFGVHEKHGWGPSEWSEKPTGQNVAELESGHRKDPNAASQVFELPQVSR